MEVVESQRLQEIASRKDSEAIKEEANVVYIFDTEDPYSCGETFQKGVESGLKLAEFLTDADLASDAKVFKINFPDYVDADGIAYFVGNEEEIASLLSSLEDDDN
jgi:hypothetical protein